MIFRYGPAARFFHWTTVILVVVMFGLGAWIKDFEPQDKAFKLELLTLHQSFGVILFVVVVLRFFVRLGNPPPMLYDQPALIRVGSRLNHYALYAMLLIQPVIGFLTTNALGVPVKWFGLFTVPSPIGRQDKAIAEQFAEAHELGAGLLVLLITLHLLGAAYHGIIRQDGVVKRMV
jgi:cytochrome b561